MKRARPWLLALHVLAAGAIGYAIWRATGRGDAFRFTVEGSELELADPRWLGLLVLVPYLSLVALWSLADLPRLQRAISVFVRGLLIAALAVGLARPVITSIRRQVATVFLVDVSDSVTDEALERAHGFLERARASRGENVMRVVTFARRPRRLRLDETSTEVPPLARHTAARGRAEATGPDGGPSAAAAGNGGPSTATPSDGGPSPAPGRDGGASSAAAGDSGPSKAAAAGAADGGLRSRRASRAKAAEDLLTRHETPGSATDLQAAVQLAYGLYPPGTIKRLVLVSDGDETQGDLLAEASRAREQGIRISFKTFPDLRPREALISKITLPDRMRVGEPFEVQVRVWASHRMDGRVTLYQGDVINGLDGIRDLTLEPGENRLAFRSVAHVAGPLTYAAALSRLPGDRFPDNNRYVVAADVTGRPTICYVEGDAAGARYLQGALAAADFDVEVRGPRAFPATLREMERFDAIVLSNVPAEMISMSEQGALEQYVRDLGGGFIMLGGPDSFGMGGYIGTTIERILPVRMDTERRREEPVLALALVIDKSGSMSGTPIELAKEAARATAGMLGPDDLIEVVAFDSRPTTVVRLTAARNRSKIASDISRLTAGGGTAIFPALDQAYRDLSTARARTKHVILLSDGQSPTEGISELVQMMAAEGITVSTVGLGPQADRALLQSIADQAGGRFHHTNDPYNIPRIFTRETSQVTRSAVVEEFFQPVVEARSELLRGVPITSAPYLRGYVSTRMKPRPAELILASDIGEPLLARWRVGLGQSVAWTSDVTNRWAVDWLRWPGYSTFWAQVVRETMRQRRAGVEYETNAEVIGGEVHVTVNAEDADDSFVNGLTGGLSVIDPRRRDEPSTVPLRQTAPGWYEARFPVGRAGTFLLRAELRNEEGRVVAHASSSVSSPYPAEYLTVESDRALLAQAATLTEGTPEVEPTAVWSTTPDEGVEYHRDLWPYLVGLALLLLLLDLLLRRVRLFDRTFKTGMSGAGFTARTSWLPGPGK